MAFRTERIETNGITLEATVAGDGPLVLLAHGFPERWCIWRHQLQALAAAGFTAAALDMRGYGNSDVPEGVDQYHVLHLVGDLVGAVTALGHDRAHLVGHDWGAAAVWHAALMRPDLFPTVTGLSLPFQPRRGSSGPVSVMRRMGEQMGGKELYMVRFQGPDADRLFTDDLDFSLMAMYRAASGSAQKDEVFGLFIDKGSDPFAGLPKDRPRPDWFSAEDFACIREGFARSGVDAPLNYYRNLDRNWELTAPWQGARIMQPALYITGAKDPVRALAANAEASLSEHVPNLAALEVIEGAGHWVSQEAPEAVSRLIVDFLSQYRS
jgi:pimeloyl-ACP methyl ester carboxylesterase